jgi:hypothetical protein
LCAIEVRFFKVSVWISLCFTQCHIIYMRVHILYVVIYHAYNMILRKQLTSPLHYTSPLYHTSHTVQTHRYVLGSYPKDERSRLAETLTRILTRQIATKAVLKMRTSSGVEVADYW